MTWTATLIRADDRDSHWKIGVEFTDGNRTKQQGYNFTGSTAAELKAFIRAKAQEFEKSDGIDLSTFIGQSIDVTKPTVDPPTLPTDAELDRAAWFSDYRKLQAMIKVTTDIPALATPQATTAIANLRTSLEPGFLNSYLDGI
jgi:hypothetical protein